MGCENHIVAIQSAHTTQKFGMFKKTNTCHVLSPRGLCDVPCNWMLSVSSVFHIFMDFVGI